MIPMLILFSIACKQKAKEVYQSSATNLDVFKVKVAHIEQSSLDGDITATGVVYSDLESKPAFKTGGVIEKTYFKEGDRINAGALLATLNMSEIKAQVEQAKKAVEKTTRDLLRVKNLYADSVATLEQMQNAQTAYDMSVETLKVAEFNQSYSKVIAPASGIVVKQVAREGEIIGPGMPICVIMGIGQSHWVIKTALSDKEWARVKKGDEADVYFEAFPGQKFKGKVDKVADLANAGTATLDVEIKLIDAVKNLAVGLISTNTIHTKINKGTSQTAIPIESLVSSSNGEAVVYIPHEGVAMKKSIQIDKITSDKVFVNHGLEGISQVITTGAVYLQDGDKIEIIK